MQEHDDLLNSAKIASPCSASWASMAGDDRVRFCSQCRLHVYNLSAMPRREAETLVRQTEGRLCVTYYLRRDGTIITRDCPVGWRALVRGTRRVLAACVALLMVTVGLFAAMRIRPSWPPIALHILEPVRSVKNWIRPDPMLGVMAAPVRQKPLRAPTAAVPIKLMGRVATPRDATKRASGS